MNPAKKINPMVKIIIAAVVALAITIAIIFFRGGRYTVLADGSKFIGEYDNGQPITGVIHCPDGDTADLDVPNNKITYKSGKIYEGVIEGGCPNGLGKMTYSDTGDVYEGNFSNSEFSGAGVYKYSNGDVFEGNYENEQKNGHGVMTYANGNSYEGEYKNDVRSGKGVFIWASGAKYTGSFADDLKNGSGIMVYENGDIFEGTFKNDMRDGDNCVYRWSNGERYNGPFRNNVMDTRVVDEHGKFVTDEAGNYIHGSKATYTFTTDRTYEGYFENGKAVGVTIG